MTNCCAASNATECQSQVTKQSVVADAQTVVETKNTPFHCPAAVTGFSTSSVHNRTSMCKEITSSKRCQCMQAICRVVTSEQRTHQANLISVQHKQLYRLQPHSQAALSEMPAGAPYSTAANTGSALCRKSKVDRKQEKRGSNFTCDPALRYDA